MSDNQAEQDDEKTININCPEEVATGKYSNLFITNVSKEELILDFAMLYPHSNSATVQSRVVLTHGNARKLQQMLTTYLDDYENKQGPDDKPGIRFSIN